MKHWLFASEYIRSSQSSAILENLYDPASDAWLVTTNQKEPTEWQVYKLFRKILSVNQNPDTGILRIAIDWPDPLLAAQWVNWLVDDINKYIKEKDVREAERSIKYLIGSG